MRMKSAIIWNILAWILASFPMYRFQCISCSGSCVDDTHCDCSTGYCDDQQGPSYCFSEKRALEIPHDYLKFSIAKGCLRADHVQLGCHFQQSRDHVLCACAGEFCNVKTDYPRQRGFALSRSAQITCFQCAADETNCARTCVGDYCHKDLETQQERCGYGTPVMPFTKQTWLLIGNDSVDRESCIFAQTGGLKVSECVCRFHGCNRQPVGEVSQNSIAERSTFQPHLNYFTDKNHLPLFKCFSCAASSTGRVLPSVCTQDICIGNYCTLKLETRTKSSAFGERRGAGCLNITQKETVRIGCFQKWWSGGDRTDENEEIVCVCNGDFCNVDLHTAKANGEQSVIFRLRDCVVLFCFCVVFMFSSLTAA